MDGEAHFIDRQVVRLEDPFGDGDLILALGGGGEGTIGRMRGRQVVSLDRSRRELEEAPDGPIKVVGEATELPFLDAAFDAVAAFFFFLYVSPSDRAAVLREARRVLKPQGRFYVWDVRIPPRGERTEAVFVVPLTIHLPSEVVQTGYGTRWNDRSQSAASFRSLFDDAGFVVEEEARDGKVLHWVLVKPAA